MLIWSYQVKEVIFTAQLDIDLNYTPKHETWLTCWGVDWCALLHYRTSSILMHRNKAHVKYKETMVICRVVNSMFTTWKLLAISKSVCGMGFNLNCTSASFILVAMHCSVSVCEPRDSQVWQYSFFCMIKCVQLGVSECRVKSITCFKLWLVCSEDVNGAKTKC